MPQMRFGKAVILMVKSVAIFILHLSLFGLFCSERRTQTPSILSAITGSGYFSCIDPEASGYAQPEQIVEFWESFGVSHGDIITVLEVSDEILTYQQSNFTQQLTLVMGNNILDCFI